MKTKQNNTACKIGDTVKAWSGTEYFIIGKIVSAMRYKDGCYAKLQFPWGPFGEMSVKEVPAECMEKVSADNTLGFYHYLKGYQVIPSLD